MERDNSTQVDEVVDVVVVGARVAGAATALQLARAGHSVALVDRVRFPSDTLSTHAIARGGMVQLGKLGLVDALHERGTPPVRSVSFHASDGVVRRTIKDSAGVDHLLAPRRHVLDALLVDAAEAAGARVHTQVRVTGVERDLAGRVTGVVGRGAAEGSADGSPFRIRARHVVGADGWRSTIARSVDATVICEGSSTAATHYRYVSGLDGDGFEYHLADGALAGVFRTNDDQACVWICCPATRTRDLRDAGGARTAAFDALLAASAPQLAARLRGTQVASPVRGATGLPNRITAPAGPGWWLVGDAGYHRDPVTGHGISDALRDAETVAGSIDGHLSGTWDERWARVRFQIRRQRSITPIFDVTCRMAQFPPVAELRALQRRLGQLIDAEANRLAHDTVPEEVIDDELERVAG